MASKLQQLIDKYESWETIPDSEKPKDSKQLEEMKSAFESGKKKMSAYSGARENLLKNSSAGNPNDKGDSSLKGNSGVVKVVKKDNELSMQPKSADAKKMRDTFREAAKVALEQMNGKSEEEQEKIANKVTGEENPAEKTVMPESKPAEAEKPAEEIEVVSKAEEEKQTPEEEKQNAFLKSWAATHPSWVKILTSKDLSFGQKVQLVGSALANLGANVTLGAKAGFEHSGFQPIDWDFKKAIDKYTSNEIDSVLAGEQKNRTKVETADFWKDYRKTHGDKAADELIALVDLYGDNPTLMQERLKSMGINKSADEIKELYSNLEKTNLSQEAKQKMLDTEAKQLANKIQKLQAKVTGKTADKLIAAQNALNNFNNIKYSSDGKTYNLEKAGSYLKNILHEVEGVASTVGGVMTGGVVGGVPSIKDGIIKGEGIPQKVVRADGSEIQLDPNDNIYATKNELITEKDNGSAIVPMNRDDEVITVQKKLGYSGGFINKDFNYYLEKLRG
jgi:hypothetical protein